LPAWWRRGGARAGNGLVDGVEAPRLDRGRFRGLLLSAGRDARFDGAVVEALALTKWYAQEHVLLCLIPAFFIAGAISVFVRQASVLKYLGPRAPKPVAYGVASVSGTILAVCSCTVLPLFGGIYANGAGLGPATAFLYSGPAINVLAIILTARILGVELGLARGIAAIVFALVIGLLMHLIFRRDEAERAMAGRARPPDGGCRPPALADGGLLRRDGGILVFANWGVAGSADGVLARGPRLKWQITAAFALLLAFALVRWIGMNAVEIGGDRGDRGTRPARSRTSRWCVRGRDGGPLPRSQHVGRRGRRMVRRVVGLREADLPAAALGILAAGLLLGRPGHEGLIPADWVAQSVGGNSLGANLFAAVAGAFMYFATLTEVPILQGLMGSGMGEGPALTLLLAGPALSLPSILVIRSMIGTKKTAGVPAARRRDGDGGGMIYGAIV
jgi:uncharacterized protein